MGTTNCGHICCAIAENQYHVHADEPQECGRCIKKAGQASGVEGLGRLVATVLVRVAPEIPGLPTGPALVDRVADAVITVYEAARHDPELAGLSGEARHRTLVGRVALALAFDGEHRP
jgi:hypothetical protein